MPKVDKNYKIKSRAQIMQDQRDKKKADGLVGFRRDVTPEHKEKLAAYYIRLIKQDLKKNKDTE